MAHKSKKKRDSSDSSSDESQQKRSKKRNKNKSHSHKDKHHGKHKKRETSDRKRHHKDVITESTRQASSSDSELDSYKNTKVQKVTAEDIGRAGGVYIPPFKLLKLQRQIEDKTSPQYQRQAWEALRKSINGLVNKVNVSNITYLSLELFQENLIRGRGLLARAIVRAQMASPGFTHVYAALLSVINSKLPIIGELVLKRATLQFRRAYRINDKVVCMAIVKFIAHLVNQRIANELLALQIAALLLEKVTEDSVEVAAGFIQECGQILSQVSPSGYEAIFERFRGILQDGEIGKRVQYTIEKLFETRRKKFTEYPGVIEELDLIKEDDQVTHDMDLLDESIKGEEILNVFKAKTPEEYTEEERKWAKLSTEILGEDEGSDGSSADSEDTDSGDEIEQEDKMKIVDHSEQDLVQLRKTIYLCIQSSINFEECTHKILKLNIKEGQEIEVCTMLIDCSSMERSFQRYFPLQAERLCRINPAYQHGFQTCFIQQYETVHRLETVKLRNVAKFFAHLLYTDALPWTLLENIQLTEETTTSSSRIFIKIIFQELSENMGLDKLNNRLQEPELEAYVAGLFPNDHPRNIRFSINFFTAIGLGGLTDKLRHILANAQTQIYN